MSEASFNRNKLQQLLLLGHGRAFSGDDGGELSTLVSDARILWGVGKDLESVVGFGRGAFDVDADVRRMVCSGRCWFSGVVVARC